jgi:cytochrome c oxidase assembly protein subunit 15
MTPMTSASLNPAAARPASLRPIAYWLIGCAGMVFAMALIGAITRLTESGLSITEWKPITGALPPLGEAAWLVEFAKYQATPEFQLKHSYMTLADFKAIFFWEWLHRLWGRLIGVVFAVPFLWLWATGRVPRPLVPRLLGLLALGGLQGGIGWFMVKSGLADRPDVSHYRLALHLLTALLIYALLLWVAIGLLRDGAGAAPSVRRHGWIGLGMLSLTILWGAFVAGLDAGQAYNSWPLMDGRFAPPEMWSILPAWLNPTENTAMVQFIHRWLAMATAIVVFAFAWGLRHAHRVAWWLAFAVMGQVLLGITTLLLQVPVALGTAHQAGAITVLTLLVWLLAVIRTPGRFPERDPALPSA